MNEKRKRGPPQPRRDVGETPPGAGDQPGTTRGNRWQYRPLSDSQIAQIYRTSIRMLAELGMGEAPPALSALECNAEINDLGHLCYPQAMVEDIIDRACKSFVFHGRDPRHSFANTTMLPCSSASARFGKLASNKATNFILGRFEISDLAERGTKADFHLGRRFPPAQAMYRQRLAAPWVRFLAIDLPP